MGELMLSFLFYSTIISFAIARSTYLSNSFLNHNSWPETHYGNRMLTGSFSMNDGETLISSSGNFQLGFFSPDKSWERYIGIWFRSRAANVKTPVWIANRKFPLFSGVILTLSDNGLLVASDDEEHGATIADGDPFLFNASLSLLDDGNLVIRSNSEGSGERTSWQSFDHPTDTILPGMFRWGWLSLPDNSFSLRLDDEIVIYQDDSVYWKSGPWEGGSFRGIPEMRSNHFYGYAYVDHGLSFTVKNSTIVSRIVLNSAGKLQQWTWSEEALEWQMLWSHPSDMCHVPHYCGAQSICDLRRWPVCQCLPGHRPASERDWRNGNFSSGCVRKSEWQCAKTASHDFLVMPNMRFKSTPYVTTNYRECELACLNNCSCTAYYYSERLQGCFLFTGDNFDIERLPDAYIGGRELHIRFHRKSTGKATKWLWPIAIAATGLVAIFLCIFLFYLRRWRKFKLFKGMNELELNTSGDNIFAFHDGSQIKYEKDVAFQLFSSDAVKAATDNFSNENKLGEGGFGPVYKGRLPEGREIAVKRLLDNSEQGLEEFKNEIVLAANLQHINLLGPLGCCIEGEEKVLIYEFMPNKSLDKILLDQSRRSSLDWGRRSQIIEGIAQGLLYLHNYSRWRIIHRDIKASNILLDAEMIPKISDFGLARIFNQGRDHLNTKRIVGTLSYMSPEYAIWGHFSEKSDVFSFGVLLLEIVSGRLNVGLNTSDDVDLLRHAWELWEGGRGLEVMDPILGDSAPSDEVIRCIHVGLLCVQDSIIDRPTMSHVVYMLRQSSSSSFLQPKQPPTYFGKYGVTYRD